MLYIKHFLNLYNQLKVSDSYKDLIFLTLIRHYVLLILEYKKISREIFENIIHQAEIN